jgi:flagella basal body P-ring formation protein FlgA
MQTISKDRNRMEKTSCYNKKLMYWLIFFAVSIGFCLQPSTRVLADDQGSYAAEPFLTDADNKEPFVTVSKEEIKKIVSDFIAQRMTGPLDSYSVKDIWVSNDIKLPAGDITYRCILPEGNDNARKVAIPVVFMVNGVFQKKGLTRAAVEALMTAVVTTRSLPRNHIITAEDVQLQKMEGKGLSSKAITRCEEVVGKKTKNAVNAQMGLRKDLIECPPLVKAGDTVLIIVESDALKITALGEVGEKGSGENKVVF